MGCSESKSAVAPLVPGAGPGDPKPEAERPTPPMEMLEVSRAEDTDDATSLSLSLPKPRSPPREPLRCRAETPSLQSLPAHSYDVSVDTSRSKSNAKVVSACARRLGMREFPNGRDDGPCDIYWHNVVYQDLRSVVSAPTSRVNKFPNMTELSRKIALTRALQSMQRLFPSEYQFYPNSWFIPEQLGAFEAHCAAVGASKKQWFIVKPDDGAQGTGIYLINKPADLVDTSERQLIQEYVADPFLLGDGLKFDFRVYAVIKSINPLSIYVAREGMARFCTEKYSQPTSSNFENLYAHLTNYSLNKGHNSYVHTNSLKDQLKGSKRLLSTVFYQMDARGVRTRRLWHNIKLIIIKTVIAMIPEMMINYEHYFYGAPGPQCFQIMGFDILVTKSGDPILLEVNSAPSLTIEHVIPSAEGVDEEEEVPVRSIVDEIIKVPLVKDCLLLVMDLLDEEYNVRASPDSSLSSRASKRSQDDSGAQKARRPHLSEIFPGRYGHVSSHLLFLDRAVYLFLQFVNLKKSTTITISGCRSFFRKCNLTGVLSNESLEKHFAQISSFFAGTSDSSPPGLPFHGFLQLLFVVSDLRYVHVDDRPTRLQNLLVACDLCLRRYGVRSSRLRRTEMETDENQNSTKIYLLPNRMRDVRRPHGQFRSRSEAPPPLQQHQNLTQSRSFKKPSPIHFPPL
ncbi:hypothetical protein QR680_017589 [Steinernema hermaphroditum]|uniref:ATP-grasp domain-containing protein n=1 Tax=Steinernema hermaphroditum TaxID=289476 RepID=A0AA39HF45_9BILA|nr:hypothetical protein QR680_017589 [Steinernema hermaphroditum]